VRLQSPRWLERCASTNLLLREEALAGAPDGSVLAAREQTAGRGRAGRIWRQSPGRDLAFSFLLRDAPPPALTPALAMAAALATAGWLAARGIEARVKWPNDVRVRRRKIAGILAERLETPTGGVVVAGIGLNLGMTGEEAAGVGVPATSVRIETGVAPTPEAALDELLPGLDARLAGAAGGFASIRAAWESMHELRPGDPVRLRREGEVRCGRFAGFGAGGELLLEEGGSVRACPAGEIDGAEEGA